MNCNCVSCKNYDNLAATGKISRNDCEEFKKNGHLTTIRFNKIIEGWKKNKKPSVITTEDDGTYDEYQDNQISKIN